MGPTTKSGWAEVSAGSVGPRCGWCARPACWRQSDGWVQMWCRCRRWSEWRRGWSLRHSWQRRFYSLEGPPHPRLSARFGDGVRARRGAHLVGVLTRYIRDRHGHARAGPQHPTTSRPWGRDARSWAAWRGQWPRSGAHGPNTASSSLSRLSRADTFRPLLTRRLRPHRPTPPCEPLTNRAPSALV